MRRPPSSLPLPPRLLFPLPHCLLHLPLPHLLFLLIGFALEAETKDFRLAGYSRCPMASHIALEVEARTMLHCSIQCEADILCKGFCYSSSQLLCKISHIDVGMAGRNAIATPGFNMFWTGYVKGFLRYGDKAYRHFASSKTHWDARNSCWNVNASLAVPLNAGENAFLASLVNTGTFWILADDATTEGVWVNTDTSDPLPYARWIVGQPDNAGGTEDCAEITYQALWNDLPCTLSRYYACEIPVAQCDQLKDDIRCSYLL